MTDKLRPATDEQIITALASALTLSAPTGFSEGDRKAWLTAAAISLKGIPPDLLQWGVAHARLVADHPAKIIPAILADIGDRWTERRESRRREIETGRGQPQLPPPSEQIVPCTPDQAAAIMEEFGLTNETRAMLSRPLGRRRNPTREDYLAMGVDPASLGEMNS